MSRQKLIEALIGSRRSLERPDSIPLRKGEAEGGCGVIGIASSVPIPGRHLLQSLQQMRNRGNSKGGGMAAVGLEPDFFGVSRDILENDYLLTVAYLDQAVRGQVEADFVEPTFELDHTLRLPTLPDFRAIPGLDIPPPEVHCYFGRVRPEIRTRLIREQGLSDEFGAAIEDEIVYQNSYRLNKTFYQSTGKTQAFVLSHGKNMIILKMVGYGDDVICYYRLEDLYAHVWIGHHRYPTKGKVWHPGGAHPFLGMHEALVHNGDFANYASICTYLAQRNIHPLFLTDTEVAVLVFDLHHRLYGYPLEYVIEAMAPTTERDFTLLPPEKQRVYRMLQAVHMHGSPDGPWFFLLAQSDPPNRAYRLIGITDTSMLRPQVFAIQQGSETIGFAASEKQAIDAALESLSAEDPRFWSQADLYWNARGGSHTDGGAFIFTVQPSGPSHTLLCTDKFGRRIEPERSKRPLDFRSLKNPGGLETRAVSRERINFRSLGDFGSLEPKELFRQLCQHIPTWGYEDVRLFLEELERTATGDDDRSRAIALLTLLMDRRYATGTMKRSGLLSLIDRSFTNIVDDIRRSPSQNYVGVGIGDPWPEPRHPEQILVMDARGYPPEGNESLARAIVAAYQRGFRRFIIANTRGQRFIGCGLGPDVQGVRIDVYGPSGDYLASGIDGAEIVVHGTAQDQLVQIMKDGTLVIHGDVGQTFMYAAKGGQVFVLGNAAGRPLINAVGRPRVVINGTCLDYLAESFMAGDPLNGGGFVILNGITFDEDGNILELDTPYPGGNLFSLASGGAIYVRDPHRKISDEQLNGGEFVPLEDQDWTLIRPYLEENERLFRIPLEYLLTVEGRLSPPELVYRKIRPAGHKALLPEEAWVRNHS